MHTQDDEIARHLREAQASGELAGTPGYGQPFQEDAGYDATPVEFRLPFKIQKNAGYAPPEVAWFRERGELQARLDACTAPGERAGLLGQLAELEQKIALRLEGMRLRGTL